MHINTHSSSANTGRAERSSPPASRVADGGRRNVSAGVLCCVFNVRDQQSG